MTANVPGSKTSSAAWIDPDDAPEWTEEMFDAAEVLVGERVVRRGRPRADHPKASINIRLSPDVVARFRATGKGWQTRIDAALKEWLASHPEIG